MRRDPLDARLLQLSTNGRLRVTVATAAKQTGCGVEKVRKHMAALGIATQRDLTFRWTAPRVVTLLERFVKNGKLVTDQRTIAKHFGCTQMSVCQICRRLDLVAKRPRWWNAALERRLRNFCDAKGRLTITKNEAARRLGLSASHLQHHVARLGIIPLVTYKKRRKA